MIKGNLGTKGIYGYTRSVLTLMPIKKRNANLTKQFVSAVKLFFDDLGATGQDQDVLAMTFSEFGRRAFENGSQGTDHGAAAPILFFGPALEDQGFVGTHPDLNALDANGSLTHHIDFRQIYATVMQEWLCIDMRP